jgi:hypothetical protein
MTRQQTADIAAAFVIGALFGIGAALLIRAGEDDELAALLSKLRQMRRISLRDAPPDRGLRGTLAAVKERLR